MKFHFKISSVGALTIFFATQLSGCSVSQGIQPSAVYGMPTSENKISAPAAKRGADLVGIVKDVSGKPVQGATVFVYTAKPRQGASTYCPSCYYDCGKHETTSANGAFRIPSLDKTLIFRLLVVKDGFEPAFVRNVDPVKSEVNLSLKKVVLTPAQHARLVRGRVLDPLGQPVVGALIEPFGVKETAAATGESFGLVEGLEKLAISNQRGEFHFLSPSAGNFIRVQVKARGLATTNFMGLISGSPQPSTIRLPWGVTVRGTVASATGKKLSGTVVRIVPTDLNAETFTGWMDIATDSAGIFTLYNVPANREYNICVKMDSLAEQNLGAVSQTVSTGHDDTVMERVTFTVKPVATITGQVVLTDGKTIPVGTRILLARKGTWDAQQFALPASGKFEFKGVPQDEELRLSVRVPGYHWADGTPARSAISTRIAPADTKQILSLQLAPDVK